MKKLGIVWLMTPIQMLRNRFVGYAAVNVASRNVAGITHGSCRW